MYIHFLEEVFSSVFTLNLQMLRRTNYEPLFHFVYWSSRSSGSNLTLNYCTTVIKISLPKKEGEEHKNNQKKRNLEKYRNREYFL